MEQLSNVIFVGFCFAVILSIKGIASWQLKKPLSAIPPILLFIVTIELFYGWLYSSKVILSFPHALRINTPLVFLLAPAVYLFIKSLVFTKMKWKKIYLLHLIPFFMVMAYLVPLYGMSTLEKSSYLENMFNQLPMDSILIGGFRRLTQLVYLIFSIQLLIKFASRLKINQTFSLATTITLLFATMWMISILRFLLHFDLLAGCIDSLVLSILSIVIVYHLLSIKSVRYKASDLPNEFPVQINRIKELLEKDKTFLNPKYSLQDMASHLGLPVTHLSSIVNKGMGTNFNQLINEYRVRKAIELLSSNETNHLTIEAIAKDSGFNSSSSFNYNFKKFTGKTPKSFRTHDISSLPEL